MRGTRRERFGDEIFRQQVSNGSSGLPFLVRFRTLFVVRKSAMKALQIKR
jgi:hypothetical protein